MNRGKGGYQILDLKNTNFTIGTGVVIEGVYEVIKSNYRKPILLSHLIISSVEYADVYLSMIKSGDSYSGVINISVGLNISCTLITITKNDTVTISSHVIEKETE